MSRRLLNKQGQLKVQETILVVFVFVVIIIIGMGLFIRFQTESIIEGNKEYLREKFGLVITTFPELPEVKCSEYGQKRSCLDTTKLTAFSIESKRDDRYREEFAFRNITIYSAYPEKNNKICTSQNQRDCGVWEIYVNKPVSIDSKRRAVTPVALYHPDKDKYSIGVLVVEGYNL